MNKVHYTSSKMMVYNNYHYNTQDLNPKKEGLIVLQK